MTGFFYVVGCLYELHVHGGNPSFRTFIGGIPMLTSMKHRRATASSGTAEEPAAGRPVD